LDLDAFRAYECSGDTEFAFALERIPECRNVLRVFSLELDAAAGKLSVEYEIAEETLPNDTAVELVRRHLLGSLLEHSYRGKAAAVLWLNRSTGERATTPYPET
jgi:hypothetical protein